MRPRSRVAGGLVAVVALSLALPIACSRPARPPEVVAPPTRTGPATVSPLPPGVWPEIALEEAWSGLDQPLLITNAGDGSDRLFIAEKTGRVRVVRGGRLLTEPYVDLSDAVSTDSERGLLGLAFSPGFARDGRFYVDYTDHEGTTVIARHTVDDPDTDTATDARAETLLTIEQPFPNHNGGCIAFGPDGMLYVGMGDGGAGGDPFGNGQGADTLLGKMLRLDVEGQRAPKPEVWATGLRNPWRFSFDRATGDLWIGDVGQGDWEEIDFQPASSAGGENYGWNLYEGSHTFPPGSARSPEGLTMPAVEYDRTAGSSVTGGFVYRGVAHPTLVGTYLYADFVTGRIWGLRRSGSEWDNAELLDTGMNIASFGEDEQGELYVVDLNGTISRLAAR